MGEGLERRRAIAVVIAGLGLTSLACRPGQPCDEGCAEAAEGTLDSRYVTECVDLVEWSHGSIHAMTAFGPDLVLAGRRAVSEAMTPSPWLGAVGADGAMSWELQLDANIGQIVAHGDRLLVLQGGISEAGSFIHEIDAQGSIVASRELALPGESDVVQAFTMWGETPIVGGQSGGEDPDLWIAALGPSGALETLVLEDYQGFRDEVTQLVPIGDGFGAIVRAQTSSGVVGDDVLVPPAGDALVLLFDDQGSEVHREVFSLGQVAFVEASVAFELDGEVLVAGYSQPAGHPEPEDDKNSAWAARVSNAGLAWHQWWDGPEQHSGSRPSAEIEAGHALDNDQAVLGGRQATATGLRRWHLILDAADGSVVEEATGGPEDGFESDGYQASGTTAAPCMSGRTHLSIGVDRLWMCEFVEQQ